MSAAPAWQVEQHWSGRCCGLPSLPMLTANLCPLLPCSFLKGIVGQNSIAITTERRYLQYQAMVGRAFCRRWRIADLPPVPPARSC